VTETNPKESRFEADATAASRASSARRGDNQTTIATAS